MCPLGVCPAGIAVGGGGSAHWGEPGWQESAPERVLAKGASTLCTSGAVCKEAISCFMVDPSKPTGLLAGLGFCWLWGHKKLLEGPKPPLG